MSRSDNVCTIANFYRAVYTTQHMPACLPPLTHTESQQQTTNSDATLISDLPAIDAAADAREAEVTEAAQAAAVPHSLSVLAKLVAGAEVRDETYIRKSRDTHTATHTHTRKAHDK